MAIGETFSCCLTMESESFLFPLPPSKFSTYVRLKSFPIKPAKPLDCCFWLHGQWSPSMQKAQNNDSKAQRGQKWRECAIREGPSSPTSEKRSVKADDYRYKNKSIWDFKRSRIGRGEQSKIESVPRGKEAHNRKKWVMAAVEIHTSSEEKSGWWLL